MRIVMMGTPDFAVPSLKALLREKYNVVGVFCQPDRPKGRGHKLAACPVKEEAVKAAVAAAKAEKELHDLPDSISDMTPEQLEQFKHFMAMQEAKKAKEKAAEQSTEQSETVAEPQEEIAVKEETDT